MRQGGLGDTSPRHSLKHPCWCDFHPHKAACTLYSIGGELDADSPGLGTVRLPYLMLRQEVTYSLDYPDIA